MPSKKSSQSHGADKENKIVQRPSSPLFKEGSDPIETVISMVEKRARNLSKRKERLSSLQKECKEGKSLDKDQHDAISKLPEVLVQIDFLHDLQKQFSELNTEYQKHLKSKQKAEEKRKKDEDKEAKKTSVKYCRKVQLMLEQFDDATKESFKNGTEGAVKLTEAELKCVDDFYTATNPSRAGNPSFEQELVSAVQHITLLEEESSVKFSGTTTYKALHQVFEKIDNCGYLDREQTQPTEEEDEEEEDVVEEEALEGEGEETEVSDPCPRVTRGEFENEEDFTTLEEVPSNILDGPPLNVYKENSREEQVRQTTPTQANLIGATFGNVTSMEPHHQTSQQHMVHVPTSAPSPDFAGLGGTSAIASMDFQFMRGDPQPSPAQTTPPSFSSKFSSIEESVPVNTEPIEQDHQLPSPKRVTDGQYVPETGQQMNDLVGTPAVMSTTTTTTNNDKVIEHSSNGSYKTQGNSRPFIQSYDNRRGGGPRSNGGNNRQRPYNRSRGGDFRDGGNYNNGPNKGMNGGRPRGSGGRGRPNYPYNRPPQNRSNGPRNNSSGNSTGTRPHQPPQQPSYASTAAAAQS